MRCTPPCLGETPLRTNWNLSTACLLNDEIGGSVWMRRSVRFLPKGFEGESEACKGYGVYGVLGVTNIGVLCGLLEDPECAGVLGYVRLSFLERFRGELLNLEASSLS